MSNNGNDGRLNWRDEQWNRLYDQPLILAIWTRACHLEVERAAFHPQLHGDKCGFKVTHLKEESNTLTSFASPQQNEVNTHIQHHTLQMR